MVLGWLVLAAGTAAAAEPHGARVLFPGKGDPAFGSSGYRGFLVGRSTVLSAILVQPDGKLVVVGTTEATRQGPTSFLVARLAADGRLDPTFGAEGFIVTKIGGHAGAAAAVLQDDGMIVVAGNAHDDFALARYDASGALDPTFAGGVVTTDFGGDEHVHTLLADAAGRLVAVGASYSSPSSRRGGTAIARYERDGTLDPSFGTHGRVREPYAKRRDWFGADAVLEPDGAIVVASWSRSEAPHSERSVLTRFDAGGRRDRVFAEFRGIARGLALAPDGALVTGGMAEDAGDSWQSRLARHLPSGDLDATFGNDGVRLFPEVLASYDRAVVIDADGRIVVVGDHLARHLPDGTLDPEFGTAGWVRIETAAGGMGAATLQPDGQIVAAGSRCGGGGPFGFSCQALVARYEGTRTQFCGDADADGVLTVSDGVQVLRAAADLPSTCTTLACDTDGSDVVSVSDAVTVLRAAADLPADLPCERSPR
jgi:uncharacterized delta-60 repeat protein